VQTYKKDSRRPSIVKGRRIQGKLPCWEVRISGIENVTRFSVAIPMWGPRGQRLLSELVNPALGKHRGSQRIYLPASQTEPVLAYLRGLGIGPLLAAQLMGRDPKSAKSGLKQVFGGGRLRRDHVERLADALESEFLENVLREDLWYDRIKEISPPEWRPVYDIEVDEDHTFVANDIVVSNCAPPFKQSEVDIVYGHGISREGSVLDLGVELGIVKKSGAWFTYEGEQLGQGRENAKAFLSDSPELMVEISEKVKTKLGIGVVAEEEEVVAADLTEG
jgi:recombination protein RecA